MSWFFKPKLSKDYVNLSVGKVYFKELTNGIVNKVTTASTIGNNVINNNLYFQLMEYQLINLSKRQLDNLPIRDGDIVRKKVKEILLRNNLILKEEAENIFTKQDTEWFEKQKNNMVGKLQNARV